MLSWTVRARTSVDQKGASSGWDMVFISGRSILSVGWSGRRASIPRIKSQDTAVVGAIIDLGLCLDLTTRMGLQEVAEAFATLRDAYGTAGKPLPSNIGGKDKIRRELDCQVIQALHLYRQERGQRPYDSVRAPFPEDEPLYEDAGFRRRNHIQIAVINTECIKGYFRPLQISESLSPSAAS